MCDTAREGTVQKYVCWGVRERKAVVFSESACSAGCKTTSLALENIDRVFVLHFEILGSVGFLKFSKCASKTTTNLDRVAIESESDECELKSLSVTVCLHQLTKRSMLFDFEVNSGYFLRI